MNVPLSVEQIYMFALSGAFTGPDLMNNKEGSPETNDINETAAETAAAGALKRLRSRCLRGWGTGGANRLHFSD